MRKLFAFASAFISATALFAQVTYSGISDESYIAGQKITPEDLEGKVVFFEYWGRNCPPCRASLPHLQDLWKKYGKTGKFYVVGSHCQVRDDDDIRSLLDKNGATFPVYQHISNSLEQVKGFVPYAVLIDHKGNLVKAGSPSELYGLVGKLVKNAPDVHFIFGVMPVKENKDLLKKCVYGADMTQIRSVLEKKSGSSEEAKAMSGKIENYISSQKKLIADSIADSPTEALDKMTAFRKMFPKEGAEFSDKIDSLKMNKDFAVLAQVRKDMAIEEAKFRKRPTPSKNTAAKFAALKKRLENIDDDSLRKETDSVSAKLDALVEETTPVKKGR